MEKRRRVGSSIMAVKEAVSVILCALTLGLSITPADSDSALDCCLTVGHKPLPRHALLSHRRQARGEGCSREAVVFTTRKRVELCAPPASQEQWVADRIRFLDARLSRCRKSRFQGKICEALKKLPS